MSLKAFHIVFVTVSTLLAFGFGGWALNQYFIGAEWYYLALGVGGLAGGAGLLIYGRYFLKKLKDIGYL